MIFIGNKICTAVDLKVGDRLVKSTEIKYDDLLILYQQYIDTYGKVPTSNLCDSKHNMPQMRIINRVLAENNVTYNDFLLKFGKVSHVRTESKDYDLFVQKYKTLSLERGKYIDSTELMNNSFGLPSAGWFVKYCPDKSVKNFTDFVKWAGFDVHYRLDKDYVSSALKAKEKELGRPLTKGDIKYDTIGFSTIVIDRIWGSLSKAKAEIGLMKTLQNQPLPFEFYRNKLDNVLTNISQTVDRKFISWKDIENPLYSENPTEHKTLTNAFKREGIDIFAYIKSKGFMMNPNNYSYKYTFDDGERVVSTMEYDFTTYLRGLGFEYNKSYFRDVMYRTFTDTVGKINCDYNILIDNKPLYVEIAGIIENTHDDKWRTHTYPNGRNQDYRDKLLRKEKHLIDADCDYLFIFKNDMFTYKYREMFENKVKLMKRQVA